MVKKSTKQQTYSWTIFLIAAKRARADELQPCASKSDVVQPAGDPANKSTARRSAWNYEGIVWNYRRDDAIARRRPATKRRKLTSHAAKGAP
jgi:hypothetical protein